MNKTMRRSALVLDFDGVLSDNCVYVDDTGKEMVMCYRSDSMGLKLLRNLEYKIVVITAEKSEVIDRRCEKMGIEFRKVKSDHPNAKLDVMLGWLKENNLKPEQVVYVGNDLNDLTCMCYPGVFGVAVNDAFDQIKKIASYITSASGGKGAVREVCDMIVSGEIDRLLLLRSGMKLDDVMANGKTLDSLEYFYKQSGTANGDGK